MEIENKKKFKGNEGDNSMKAKIENLEEDDKVVVKMMKENRKEMKK